MKRFVVAGNHLMAARQTVNEINGLMSDVLARVELPRSIFTKVQADLSLLWSFALFIAFLFYCWQVGQSYSSQQNRM
jgi:hypothetical protein